MAESNGIFVIGTAPDANEPVAYAYDMASGTPIAKFTNPPKSSSWGLASGVVIEGNRVVAARSNSSLSSGANDGLLFFDLLGATMLSGSSLAIQTVGAGAGDVRQICQFSTATATSLSTRRLWRRRLALRIHSSSLMGSFARQPGQ